MATDLTAVTADNANATREYVKRISLADTNVVRVDLPSWIHSVWVSSTAAWYYPSTGTDGAALGTEYFTVPANVVWPIDLKDPVVISNSTPTYNTRSIYVAGAAAQVLSLRLLGVT